MTMSSNPFNPFGQQQQAPPPAPPFGQQQQAGIAGFGAAPTSGGFGTSQPPQQGPFGTAAAAFGGASSDGFGGPPFGVGGFASGQQQPGFAPAASASSTMFAPPASAPFGSSSFPTVDSPFAGGGGFGTSASTALNPFGNNSTSLSGPVQYQQAPTTTMSFGMSSNVVRGGGGIGNDTDMGSSPTPFAGDISSSSPFGSTYSAQPQQRSQKPASNLPFGTPPDSAPSAGSAWPPSTSSRPFGLASASTSDDAGYRQQQEPQRQQQQDGSSEEQKLADLRARIEEKKKKLLEQKRKKEQQSRSRSPSPEPPSGVGGSALAQRNALRFAASKKNEATRNHMPSDLQFGGARAAAGASSSSAAALVPGSVHSGREHLSDAVTLVGTCQYMCPDEELVRREREGDIQLLETPRPGELHPPDWTLRNTAVKRFRRSAADYKLDVPEWVRPPDVLERVCGYLEEWVMVSRYFVSYVLVECHVFLFCYLTTTFL